MTKAQVASAAQLQAALASYWGRAAVPLPVIVAGDFNTLSYKHWDPAHRAARRLRAAHVTETVREEAGGRGPRGLQAPATVGLRGRAGRRAVLHVRGPGVPALYRLRVLPRLRRAPAVPCIGRHRPQAAIATAPWPSDHLCLVAAFDLTGAGPLLASSAIGAASSPEGCCRNYHPQVPIEALGDHNWYY